VDVGGRVESLRDDACGVLLRVLGDVLGAHPRHFDGRLGGALDANDVRRPVEGHPEHVEPAAEVGARRRRADGNHVTT